MKKICYCTTIPLTFCAFMLRSVEYLHEHTDWDISVICSNDEDYVATFPEYIHYYPIDMKRGLNFDGIAAIRKMKKIFKENRFDMVQFSTPNAALYASIAAKSAGVPIRNYHLMGLRYMGSSGIGRDLLKRMEKTACRNATDIECVSRSNLLLSVKEGLFPAEKATVVWNGSTGGVDLKRFDHNKRSVWRSEIREKLGISDSDFVYGFVGRLTKDKGVNELLQAFLDLDSDAKLLLIGFTSEVSTLDRSLLERAQHSDRVIFHESVRDIERYFAAIDVLALPSYREGFGNVVIEAAAVGTPAIVSDIPGPTDAVVDGQTALTVRPGDPTELKDAMIRIRELDYQLMGEQAAKFAAEHFDSEKLFEKILERKQYLFDK